MLFQLRQKQRLRVALHINGVLELLLQSFHLGAFLLEESLAFCVMFFIVVFGALPLAKERLVFHPQTVFLVFGLDNVLLQCHDALLVRLALALELRLRAMGACGCEFAGTRGTV